MVSSEPRNRTVRSLYGEQARDGLDGLPGGEDSGQDEMFRGFGAAAGQGHLAAVAGRWGLVA